MPRTYPSVKSIRYTIYTFVFDSADCQTRCKTHYNPKIFKSSVGVQQLSDTVSSMVDGLDGFLNGNNECKIKTMFGDSRSDLSPSIALALANSYMETARRNTGQPALVLEFCMDADRALSRIPRSAKRALLNSTSFADKATASLREGIAAAYYEHGQMFQRLGHPEEAQRSYRKAEKWGFNGSNKNVSSANVPARNIATIPADIFDKDMPPIVAKYSLPNADEPLNNVNQLVYCLSLLPNTPIQLSDLTEPEREWSLTRANDTDEKERLHNLAVDLLYMFINDGVKAEATVTEVVSLAPVLEQVHFRKLLMTLANGINQNIMLDTHLLEGLAQAMQHGHPKHLESDDLVTLLNILSSRLQDTHFQSSDHIYRLTVTVSHVLDTMVGNQVTGLKREQLHEPLSAYLSELKNSSDPYLVYYAAYAFQALQYIPDDEPTMQTFLRRTSAVLRGVFGVVSAVKGLDINTLINELEKVQTQLPSLVDIVNLSKLIYDGTTSLVGSGSTFMECMKEGLSFARKTAWYPALRMADAFLQTGELTKFKDFVCEVPCRLDPAFQWGLCQRLGQIAANLHWAMDTRQDAVSFLGEIYKNDSDWGSHAHIKQWILIILKKLSSHSTNNLQGKLD
ncbi:hypothetical protein BX616_010219 [Lobosporangium transversale]|nr:hypothetical protein BX616_010219 [Lobosporangium transversale]